MKGPERIMLIVGGLMCIGAAFLPYFVVKLPLPLIADGSIVYSGDRLVRGLLDLFNVLKDANGKQLLDLMGQAWNAAGDVKDKALLIGVAISLGGPIYFALFGLGYLVRGLIGKHYAWGVFFAILFLGYNWGIFYLVSQSLSNGLPVDVRINFFSIANFGFWIAFAGMFLAAMSSFFDPSTKAKK